MEDLRKKIESTYFNNILPFNDIPSVGRINRIDNSLLFNLSFNDGSVVKLELSNVNDVLDVEMKETTGKMNSSFHKKMHLIMGKLEKESSYILLHLK